MASLIAPASGFALPTAAELLAEFPEAVQQAVQLAPLASLSHLATRRIPVFNYHEMGTDTLRGILAVTASVHPEAELIGNELRVRNSALASRKLRECDSVQTWLTPRLEADRAELEELLEQDDLDRQNLCSSGMSYVVLEERTRTKYEDALRLIVDELDARAIEGSDNEALEQAVQRATTPVEEDAQFLAEEDAQFLAEEAERAERVKAGKCADCSRPKCENRHGECLHCMDDQEQAEEKEAEYEHKHFYYMLGGRFSRATGEMC